jgi:hypothetical protein
VAINVYWSCIENEWMRAIAPEPVSSLFYKSDLFDKSDPGLDMVHCPSFNDNLKNVYALRSIYSYSFTVNNGAVESKDYNQDFFNRHVIVKSIEKRLFSFSQALVFFTDEPSLKVTLSEPPFLEDNVVTKRTLILPGTMDIGKWFRNTDTMFYLRPEFHEFSISEGDVYGYVRFHTDQPINFIQFRQTPELNSYLLDSIRSKENKKRPYKMLKYYDMFRAKDLILKEIQSNLLGSK